jgi:hypothetical protein
MSALPSVKPASRDSTVSQLVLDLHLSGLLRR